LTAELHTGTVTFLFTDIEGSTALLHVLGSDRYHDVLVEHQRLLRQAFTDAGGREVDTQGDAFFVAFGRARDAVAAATAAQRALARHDWPDGVTVRVRIGIDTGEPVAGEGRYVGLGIHRTARIMSAAHGGQILLSRTTRDLIRDDLPPGTELRVLGKKRLKDLAQPVELFQVVTPDLPSQFPRLRTTQPGPVAKLLRPAVAVPVVAAGALIAVGVVLLTRGPAVVNVAPNSVGVIDARSGKVIDDVPVGVRPGSVALGFGSAWVANQADGTLTRIDERSRVVQRNITLGATPAGLASGYRALWVAEGARGAVAQVDPNLNVIAHTFRHLAGAVRVSGGLAGSVAIGRPGVWAAFGSTEVVQIHPASKRATPAGFAGFGASGITYGAGRIWVSNRGNNTVTPFSVVAGKALPDIAVGSAPAGIAYGAGSVWVADSGSDAVSQISAVGSAVNSTPVGRAPSGIAYGAGAVWVANSGDGTVSRIDPATRLVTGTIKVGGRPAGVAVAHGLVWVTVDAP